MVHINGKDMDVAGKQMIMRREPLLWNATRRSSIKRITKRTS
jgi:hypothetical protein